MIFNIRTFTLSDPADLNSSEFAKAYAAWKRTWSEEYATLGLGTLHSDGFTRQDQIVAFFVDGACAGLCCFREYDLSKPHAREDSWFTKWPADVMDEVCKRDPRVLVGSAFCLAPEFRRQQVTTFTLKQLLAASAVHHMIHHTDYRIMLGSMRNTRGTNHAVTSVGAECLRTIEVNAEPTDLVVFDRQKLPPLPAAMDFLFRRAWLVPPRTAKVRKAA